MIQDLSGSCWCIKRTHEYITRVDSPAPLMRQHDPDRSWITDPDPDHPKGMQPNKLEKHQRKWVATMASWNVVEVNLVSAVDIGRVTKYFFLVGCGWTLHLLCF